MDRLITLIPLLPKPKVAAAALAGLIGWVALQLGVELPGQALDEAALALVMLAAAWWKREHQPDARSFVEVATDNAALVDVEPFEHDVPGHRPAEPAR